MISLYKVVVYLKDVPKPIVMTCSENETNNIQIIIDQINEVLENKSISLKFESGDMIMFPGGSNSIKTISITKDRE